MSFDWAPAAKEESVAQKVRALKTLIDRWKNDPVAFVKQSYVSDPEGEPVVVDRAQQKVLEAISQHDRVVVRGPRGVGKTAIASWITHWWLGTREPSLVVTSAGTWNHLEDKLWPEIHTWGQNWLMKDAFEWLTLQIRHLDKPKNWRAMAASSDEAGNVEGFHSPHLLIIIDEAKQMADDVYSALIGSLTQLSAHGAKPKVLILSTPPVIKAGWFVELFSSKSERWHTLHLTAEDSSRISKEWVEEMAETFGVESAFYKAHVLGEIPDSAGDAVIPVEWFEAAQRRQPENDHRRAVITCDVARQGEDLTVVGRIEHTKFEIPLVDGRRAWRSGADTMETAGLCTRAVIQFNAAALCIDDNGVGGGVTDRIRELKREGKFPKNCEIIALNFGESADRADRFTIKKDELWWKTRELVRSTLALPSDQEIASWGLPRGSSLRAQLTSAVYGEGSTGRLKVWDKRDGSKNEKIKNLPSKSPDVAHSMILGGETWARLRPEEAKKPQPQSTQEQFELEILEAMKKQQRKAPKKTAWHGRNW